MTTIRTDLVENIKDDLVERLEVLVDKHSLFDVLSALELMCYEKSSHIKSNWQDCTLAKSWDRDGNTIYSVLNRIQN